MFETLDLASFNETDVREEILAPLIRQLGYRSGTDNNVIREQSLRYPRAFIGRKKLNTDPLLRGKADYILEAGGAVRWVIEAKSPDSEIDVDSIEQAFTYANHPEVRAVYFVLSNGKRFAIFQTNQGPQQNPVMEFGYEELNDVLPQLGNILGPTALQRDHPSIVPDLGCPLGPGLRSVARIANGLIRYEHNSVGNPVLNELQTGITAGAVERDESGHMVAFLKTYGPSQSLQELNEKLGLSSFEMISTDKQISIDPERPTTFLYDKTLILPEGEQILDMNTWSTLKLPANISCHVIARAEGFLEGNKFSGSFTTKMNYIEGKTVIRMAGSFEIYLA